MEKTKDEIEAIATTIVDSIVKVHRALGPGLLESAYQACLAHELRRRGVLVETEVNQPVVYEGLRIDVGYRIDMLVEKEIIVENKAVQSLIPIFEAQILTHLKLAGKRLGFLVNWNVRLIKEGIHRRANGL